MSSTARNLIGWMILYQLIYIMMESFDLNSDPNKHGADDEKQCNAVDDDDKGWVGE